MVGSTDPQGANQIDLQQGAGQQPSHSYSPLQLLVLLRLTRLLRQRQDYQKLASPPDWRVKLLSKAIYSTYCDCVSLGIGGDAKDLFPAPGPDHEASPRPGAG